MIDATEFDAAYAPVRELVRADGGDLVVESLGEDDARLRLVLEGADCHECVMPRAFLEQVATDMIRRAVPALTRLTIEDPRETAER